MKINLVRACVALITALVASCGGGGGGGDGAGFLTGVSSSTSNAAASLELSGSMPDWGFARQTHINDLGGPGSTSSGASSGSGSAGASGEGGSSTSTAASTGAGGVGSGGTGVSASAGDSADSGVGGVSGVASIIINGVRYSTEGAVLKLRDAPQLQLGMTARVNGPTNEDFTSGQASEVESAADARGLINSIDARSGDINLLGMKITTDAATVWGNVSGFEALSSGVTVQVWGLPAGPNTMRATRVERVPSGPQVISGRLQNIELAGRRFKLGGLSIDFSQAPLPHGAVAGTIVRVRASTSPVSGVLQASSIELWYPVSLREGTRRQLGGTVTDFYATSNFQVLGIPVDASTAQISGGTAAMIANGAEIELAGAIAGNKLIATKLKIKRAPDGPVNGTFTAMGTVGAFKSLADFKIKGQAIDASAQGVQFINGAASAVGNGRKVTVVGERIINDVLIATQVTFD